MVIFGENVKLILKRVKAKPRISKQKAISEIVKGLRKGMATEDILVLIGTKWNFPRTTFYRYLEEAQETHSKEQQEIERLAREQLLQTKKEELKSEILSIQQRKEFLTKLITAKTKVTQFGKATIETLENDDGRLEVVTNDIKIKALQELNKMDGAYTPTQFEDVTERKPLHEIFTFIDNNNDKDK